AVGGPHTVRETGSRGMTRANVDCCLLAVLQLDKSAHALLDQFHPGDPEHQRDHRFAQHKHNSLPAFECGNHEDDARGEIHSATRPVREDLPKSF
ncbi:MAG: hypothetical protein ACK6DX_04270, partial [Acidobacteriota bacterium]